MLRKKMKQRLGWGTLLVFFLLISSTDVWGQFIVKEQATQEHTETMDSFVGNSTEETPIAFAGNPMMTIGKTMTATAIMAGLTHGSITFLSMISSYQPTSLQKYSDKALSITEISSFLIGLPLWIIGKATEKHPKGEQYLGNPKGFGLRVDMAANVTPLIGIDCIAGYHLNPYLFVGGGIGSRFVEGLAIPAFVDIRATYSPKRVAPYIGLKGGFAYYENWVGTTSKPFDSFFSLNLGIRIRHKHNDNSRGDWWFGCVTESSPTRGINNGLQVSYSF